jgi:hypothetical protein
MPLKYSNEALLLAESDVSRDVLVVLIINY